jgi:hypothetical protein
MDNVLNGKAILNAEKTSDPDELSIIHYTIIN